MGKYENGYDASRRPAFNSTYSGTLRRARGSYYKNMLKQKYNSQKYFDYHNLLKNIAYISG